MSEEVGFAEAERAEQLRKWRLLHGDDADRQPNESPMDETDEQAE